MTHPKICDNCDGQVWRPLFGYVTPENSDNDDGSHMGYIGFECKECEATVLTDPIPDGHAKNDGLNLPEKADRDMVRED